MCEIFPEVGKCCVCCTLRVAMLYICILSICTGSMILNVTLKSSGINMTNTVSTAMQTYNDKSVEGARKNAITNALTVAMGMGFIYIVCGIILLFANLFDEEGYMQIFVWLIFLNVVIGLMGVLYMAAQCTVSTCALSKLDWLSGSLILICITCYLFLWIYFISVANSYILQRTG